MPLMRLTRRIAPGDLVAQLPEDLTSSGGVNLLLDPGALAAPAAAPPASGAGDTDAGASGGDAVAPPATTSVNWLLACYAAVAAGALISVLLWHVRHPSAFAPGAGISLFAPLYILAQAIERLLDPLTSFVTSAAPAGGGTKADGSGIGSNDPVQKADAILNVNKAIVGGNAQLAADWQAVVDQIRKNTTLLAWTAASVLALLACGVFGLYMMRMAGFKSVPEWADVLITGLAVGSGTKPLHDLIANLQSSAQNKQDPAEKQAA